MALVMIPLMMMALRATVMMVAMRMAVMVTRMETAATKHRTSWNSSARKSVMILKVFIDNVVSFHSQMLRCNRMLMHIY